MALIKVPHRFFEDHKERDLDTPKIVKATARHFLIDVVLFGPGESDQAHTPGERVSLRAYRDSVHVYSRLIRDWSV